MEPTRPNGPGARRWNRSRDWTQRGLSLLTLVGIATAVAAGLFAYAAVVDDQPQIATSTVSAGEDEPDASPEPPTTPPEETPEPAPPTTASPTTAAPPTTTAPPTTAPPTTTAPTSPREPSPNPAGSPPADGEERDHLTVGSEGPEVEALQARLVDLGYYVPSIDGDYGSLTQQAVMAFQKVEGLSRDGVAGPQTLAALDDATRPTPREPGDHIEIDLDRQVMFVTRNSATYVFNTSTGREGRRTPPGRFEITREIDGMRHAPLGDLWRPKYFNGGIALHGAESIPGHPASAGCARLHNRIIDLIWDADLAPVGTPVWVY